VFFPEKKEPKTFASLDDWPNQAGARMQMSRSFLVLFFKKEHLP
jgi:hypothetical protein